MDLSRHGIEEYFLSSVEFHRPWTREKRRVLENPISTIASVNGGPKMRLTMRIQGNHTLPVAAESCDLVSDTKWNEEEALTYRRRRSLFVSQRSLLWRPRQRIIAAVIVSI